MNYNQLLVTAGMALALAFSTAADAQNKRTLTPKKKIKTTQVAAKPAKPVGLTAASAVFMCVATPDHTKPCLELDDPQFNREADKDIEPASLLKLWTAYTVYRSAHDKLDQHFITLTPQDRLDGATCLRNGVLNTRCNGYFPPGISDTQSLTAREAIWALMGFSDNRVAVASAKKLSPDGTEAGFAAQMTHELRSYNILRTTFRNASGMPWDGQVTTPRDVANILNRIVGDIGQEKFIELFGNRDIRIGGLQLTKRGKPVGNAIDIINTGDDSILGGKTGHVRNTNNIALATSIAGNITYTVVHGNFNDASRDSAVAQLIRQAEKIIPSAQAAQPLTPR